MDDDLRFTWRSANYFHKKTHGVPRLINRLANVAVDEALKGKKKKIGVRIVKRAEGKVNAARGDWIEEKRPPVFAPRLTALLFLLFLSAGLYLYHQPEWLDFLTGVRRGETQPVPLSSRFALRVGTFLKREEADGIRDILADLGFPSVVVVRDLGDGWSMYQVRLTGSYSLAEAEVRMEQLRRVGIQNVDKVQVNPRSAH